MQGRILSARFYMNTTPFLLENQKKRGFGLKEKFSIPCCLLPQTLSPFKRGLKRTTGRTVVSNRDRCRSVSATVFILSFWLNHITAAKKERLLPYEINGCLFFIYITDLKDSLL